MKHLLASALFLFSTSAVALADACGTCAPTPTPTPALAANTGKQPAAAITAATATTTATAATAAPADVLFLIGTPDARSGEFALAHEGYAAFPKKFRRGVHYTVGKSAPAHDWPFVHPSKQDRTWARLADEFPFTIHFNLPAPTTTTSSSATAASSPAPTSAPLTLVLGYAATQGEPSPVHVTINGHSLPPQQPRDIGAHEVVFDPRTLEGKHDALLFTLPAAALKPGANSLTITLRGRSWLLYDYVALRKTPAPLAITHTAAPSLLADLRKGPAAPLRDVRQIVFAVRADGIDEHWYANFGYYAAEDYYGQHNQSLTARKDPATGRSTVVPGTDFSHYSSRNLQYVKGGLSRLVPEFGGKLCLLDLDSKKTKILLDDPTGAVRDPQVSYDASKILFSYRPGGTHRYHLYEIRTDGSALRQLTDGDDDDIEPTYTADGKIIFVSSRAKRWVQCWNTPVAILHGCDADGKNIRPLSGNVEHDNTPWPLPNGQILYTRWEYVDRSQVHFHHLWTMNPDGTQQMVYFGNMHPGYVFIDAKPVAGTGKVVAVFSPGHGRNEHAGPIGIIDPRNGPDERSSARQITRGGDYRDPWAFSETAFMAARGGDRIVLFNDRGNEETLWQLPREWRDRQLRVQEPRPIAHRQPERRVNDATDDAKPNGRLILTNVYEGRNMTGIKPGEIKKLLIIETLPKPINFTGGMEPLTYGGSFTLERIVGTVPVEADGSAHFELPALRAFFFVALDKDDLAVKRMQSFLSLMPGEVNSCIGCHEERTAAPRGGRSNPVALRRPPSPITPVADYQGRDALGNRLANPTGIPDIIDFPRDIQPVLDRNCVPCHNAQKRAGGVNLTGHRAPLYSISYYTITARSLVADGRNLPKGNYPPRTLGSSASRILKLADGSHGKAKLTPREQTLLRLWVETGATYPGTYAGLGSGMLGGYAQNRLDRRDTHWPETQAMEKTLRENCASCHNPRSTRALPLTATHEIGGPPWDTLRRTDVRRRYSRNLLYDLTVPADSALLLAPLAKSAGGYETCGKPIFADKTDPRYKTILAGIERSKHYLDTIKRFDMPGFLPRPQYIRELKKYGIVPATQSPSTPVNVYDLEQKYWQSLWHLPANKTAGK
ncbi:MAG: hypothetical protein LBT53_06100 [Puniceicoccales bacterium]|nr:hypothetical protein [Puniceicoccales bacterium]